MSETAEGSGILIVYGIPPTMNLVDASGRDLGKVFELTRSNQPSFEAALRRALADFLGEHLDVHRARMAFVKNARELVRTIAASGARRIVYYGHAMLGTRALLLSIGQAIEPWQLADALKGSSVRDFDILGCEGTSIAADLSIRLPKIKIGYLRAARNDNIEVDRFSLKVKTLKIDEQPLHHFQPKAK